jgi:hypothetical protein
MQVERRHAAVDIDHPDRRGAQRACPRCGAQLRFALRAPVMTAEGAESFDDEEDSDELRFESAWLCQNADCAYRDVVVEDPG